MSIERLATALEQGEDDLTARFLGYADNGGGARGPAINAEDWRSAVGEPARALAQLLRRSADPESSGGDDDVDRNPAATFGVMAAKRHRQRGVRLEMFLGACKLIRRAFVGLAYDLELSAETLAQGFALTHSFWDTFELGFVAEWSRDDSGAREDALREENELLTAKAERFEALFNATTEPAIIVDEELRLVDMNPAFEALVGQSRGDLIGRTSCELFTRPAHGPETCPMAEAFKEGGSFTDFELRLFEGARERTLLYSGSALNDARGSFTRAIGVFRDVTEKRQASAALKLSEERFREVFEHIQSGVAIYEATADGESFVFRAFNSAAERIDNIKRADLVGRDIQEAFPGVEAFGLLAVMRQVHRSGEPAQLGVKEYGDGRVRGWRKNYVCRLGDNEILVVYEDVTEQKEREARQRHLQKMESIGTLASGVAHEINNPINIVMNCAELILDDAEIGGAIATNAGHILHAGHRVAEIVRGLLAFAREDREHHSAARLEDIIESTVGLVERALNRDDITLSIELPPDLPLIKCRTQQIQQVLLNLLTNARDSLDGRFPDSDGDGEKKILIRAQPFERGSESWIRTTVEDYGVGVTATQAKRVFDPFYTTKPRSKGTGLGLAVSHGIVTEHGGHMSVESDPGRWTCFHVDLRVDGPKTEPDDALASEEDV